MTDYEVADFADPIGFIYTEHERIRSQWDALLLLADAPDAAAAAGIARALVDFLADDLPKHVADEEADMFPLLEARALPDDGIRPVLALLRAEHREDVELGGPLARPLEAIAAGAQLPEPELFRAYARAVVTLQRRHHLLENNVVLPLAFDRFDDADMADLGRRFAARRAVDA